jgi:oligopeptide transport system ATP-binding protein
MNKQPLLSCDSIVKQYPTAKSVLTGRSVKSLTAVDHVSLELHHSETLGIVGESGSGKSTLCDILGDLQHPTSGQVFYKGSNIRTMSREQYRVYRRNVQFIFQDPKGSLNAHARIGDILVEPLITLKLESSGSRRRQMALELLESVGLEAAVIDKYPAQLSGGQCQRIVIARALITKPEVIVCDEAVSALDVSVQAQILNLLRDLQDEHNISYLFISHDIGVVNYMADRIAVMQHGRIVEQGLTDDVLQSPQNEYTKQLIACSFARR